MLACLIVATVGFLFADILQDKLLAYTCVLPGVTWFASCAILGTTAQYVGQALKSSESTLQALIDRGALKP